MQTTKDTSKAGQLKGCTSIGAAASNTTDIAILINSHNMKLTALAPGDTLESLLVMPRAIKTAGTTTTADPYKADAPTDTLCVMAPKSNATTPPTAACAATTRQGDTAAKRGLRDCTSSRVKGTTGS